MLILSWNWSQDAGHAGFIGPSTISCTALALSSPHAIRITRLALSMVDIPIVMAALGVAIMSPLKFFAWAFLDLYESWTTLVRLLSREPASLNPTCPCSPTPITRRSSPEAALSKAAQYSVILSSCPLPSGIWMFSFFTST